jgi:hypothetical protein
VVLFPEQLPFGEMLHLLGFTQEDENWYKQSLEHYIWQHVLKDSVEQLSDEEKRYLEQQIREHQDDAGVIPRGIAKIHGAEVIKDALKKVSQKTLDMSLQQLEHHIPPDKPEYKHELQRLAGEVQPVKIDLTQWIATNPFIQDLFTTTPNPQAQVVCNQAQRLYDIYHNDFTAYVQVLGFGDRQQTPVRHIIGELCHDIGTLLQERSASLAGGTKQ